MVDRRVMIDQYKNIQVDLINKGNDILLKDIKCSVNRDRSLVFIELIEYIDLRIKTLELEEEP